MFKQGNYSFQWKDLGDIENGRPNLGNVSNVAVYRLMQYTLRDIANTMLGVDKTNTLFVEAGRLAGTEFCKNILDMELPFNEFIADLQEKLRDLNIGILRIEEADLEKMRFVLTVEEDLDCSGLEDCGETICDYDEGFIAGILGTYTDKNFDVKEIDCWTSGDRVCRFSAQLKK